MAASSTSGDRVVTTPRSSTVCSRGTGRSRTASRRSTRPGSCCSGRSSTASPTSRRGSARNSAVSYGGSTPVADTISDLNIDGVSRSTPGRLERHRRGRALDRSASPKRCLAHPRTEYRLVGYRDRQQLVGYALHRSRHRHELAPRSGTVSASTWSTTPGMTCSSGSSSAVSGSASSASGPTPRRVASPLRTT